MLVEESGERGREVGGVRKRARNVEVDVRIAWDRDIGRELTSYMCKRDGIFLQSPPFS